MTDDRDMGPASVAMRPEDMLEDEVDEREINGVRVRKGTLGAFIVNVARVERYPAASPEREEILSQIRQLVPAVRAIGMFEAFEPRAQWLRDLIDELGA